VTWMSNGAFQPGADDFTNLWLLFRTFLPQVGGLVLMLAKGRSAWRAAGAGFSAPHRNFHDQQEGNLTKQTDSITNAIRRVPPQTQSVVELLRRAGHRVLVRKRASDAGLAYKLNDDRWRTALQLTNRARRLGVI
jgi:hypothetical protein